MTMRDDAGRDSDSDADSAWWPVAVAWPGFRERLPHELQAGLASIGAVTRLDELGTAPLRLTMLRVRTPYRRAEAAESWLTRLIQPLAAREVDWAGDVWSLLHQRWSESTVWTGTQQQWRTLEPRLQRGSAVSAAAFVGGRWTVSGVESRALGVFARSAAGVVRLLPDVEIHAPQHVEAAEEWVALAAVPTSDAQALVHLEDELTACGLHTCRYEIRSSVPGRTLLTVHAGSDDLQQLEARLVAATGRRAAPWARAARSWIALAQIAVHRCQSHETRRLFDRLRAALPDVEIDCSYSPLLEDSGLLMAPLHEVDRVVGCLRSLGDDPRRRT